MMNVVMGLTTVNSRVTTSQDHINVFALMAINSTVMDLHAEVHTNTGKKLKSRICIE